jgi:hypothetical protein
MRPTTLALVLMLLVFMLLPGCFPIDGGRSIDDRAGFFTGIWHGWIAPISLIVGIFDRTVRVYEVMNTGWWYDLGFYMAIISGFGGLSLVRKRTSSES